MYVCIYISGRVRKDYLTETKKLLYHLNKLFEWQNDSLIHSLYHIIPPYIAGSPYQL